MKNALKCALVTGFCVFASVASPAWAGSGKDKQSDDVDPGVWRLSTGVNYSSGKYGEPASTKVVSAPIALKYKKGNLSVRVSTSWVHVNGPGSLIQTPEGRDPGGGATDTRSSNSGPGSSDSGSGSGSSGSGSGSSGSGSGSSGSGSGSSGSGSSGSGSGGSGSGSSGGSSGTSSGGTVQVPVAGVASNKRSGIGDTVVAATYTFDLGSGFWIDATGKLKLPTASTSKRLGTGKVDVTTALDFGKDIGDFSIYAGARHKFAGSSATSTVRDTWGAGGGASIRTGTVTLGADYDWQQSAFAGQQASSEVTAWASVKASRRLNISVFASTGLNSNSTDFAGGLTLSLRLN